MKATKALHDIGQSLWLDNIARALLTSGTLGRYRDDLAVTGLTSNPTIFDHGLKHGTDYDAEMRQKLNEAGSPEELFLALALTDLCQVERPRTTGPWPAVVRRMLRTDRLKRSAAVLSLINGNSASSRTASGQRERAAGSNVGGSA